MPGKPKSQENKAPKAVDQKIDPNKRSPVVVVLGHVDHGKTSLLAKIRQANLPYEPGNITQGVGAYEIEHNGRRITFIDTPGHEAFKAMRSRGVKIADIAILLVASDDGVQEQTKEAIKIIKDSKIPYVVAFNKIDKGVDLSNVKNQLTAEGVLLEGYGGNVSNIGVSAKTGENLDELLDLLLLSADMENMAFNNTGNAKGFILEAKLDPRKGNVVSAILKDGILKTGEYVICGESSGKIRSLENFLGKKMTEATPSSPVTILGFSSLPKIGDEFTASGVPNKAELKKQKTLTTFKRVTKEAKTNALNIILKADVSGSLETLSEIIKTIPHPKEISLKIIDESVGEITDGDANLAISVDAEIIGFKTLPTKAADNLIRDHRIKCFHSEIIYDLLKHLEERFKLLADSKKGILEVLAIFLAKGKEQTIGGKVIMGEISNNSSLEIWRKEEKIGDLKIVNLQQNRKDAMKVVEGLECGMLVLSDKELKIGDQLILR